MSTKKTTKKPAVKTTAIKSKAKVEAKQEELERVSLVDYCEAPEVVEKEVEHDGKILVFLVREFVASDREGLVQYLEKVSELHEEMKAKAAAAEETGEKVNFTKSAVKEHYWMQEYKSRLAFQLLVDKNGAPLWRSYKDMTSRMKPAVLDKVGQMVNDFVNKGGVPAAEKH